MRREATRKDVPPGRAHVGVMMCSDLVERVELSARQRGLSRSSEISRLIIAAFEKGPRERTDNTTEITGHIV